MEVDQEKVRLEAEAEELAEAEMTPEVEARLVSHQPAAGPQCRVLLTAAGLLLVDATTTSMGLARSCRRSDVVPLPFTGCIADGAPVTAVTGQCGTPGVM